MSFRRRATGELLHSVLALAFAAAGFCYVLLSVALGAGLAFTAIGIPLFALALYGARRLGGLHRALAARLLDEHVEAPAPVRPGTGFYGRVQAMLSDVPGWRAMTYLLLQVPAGLLQAYVVVFTWIWGVVALTYPIQFALGLDQDTTRDGRRGFVVDGFYFDTLPRELLVSLGGLLLLLLAPWAVHAATVPNRLLLRWLLGPHRPAERIQALEQTRAQAVDDAAATLRRIERDLHDGAQARLVALTMQLTLVKEAVPPGPARELATAAQDNAREAVAELRELVRGIHPPVLDQGLVPALHSLAARCGLPVRLRADAAGRPSAAIESIAYFCTAELLTNAAKHSGATRAEVAVSGSGGRLRVRVSDDGRGGARAAAGGGLAGLADRVRTVDGALRVDSPAGGPTVVTVELPFQA
ncbi:sensor histidine kinase [Actinomadura macrotermitis]|uniref:histidine kinase n=1 Tax=Actinomadura macrotermitis TaxID=2585200 RepID=A0A7K0BTA6_9ACTN|nr:sensor histidine kinase [Actinomadura macrotermitis]MQY04423.1 hypothetical protein [Actinomadura macrotermitis]